jgi:hypothetical protein
VILITQIYNKIFKKEMTMKTLNKNNISSSKLVATLLCFAILSTSLNANAMECSVDADCAEGEYCEILEVYPSAPCFIDEEGNEICEDIAVDEEEVLGFCEERPIECMQDSDCPSHLSCGWGDELTSGSSAGSSEGSEGFAPSEMDSGASEDPAEGAPAQEAPDELPVEEVPESLMCVFVPSTCESDNDCAMNFHCEVTSVSVGCAVPEIICEEGEDCAEVEPVDCEEEEYSEGYCMPNEIECDSDAACPSDWRCRELIESSCGGDDIDVAIGAPEPAPNEEQGSSEDQASSEGAGEERMAAPVEEPAERPVVDCEETVRSICVPVGLGSVRAVAESGLAGGGTSEIAQSGPVDEDTTLGNNDDLNAEEAEGSSNSVVEDEGGCDAQSSKQSSWMMIFGLALLAFRRRLA